MAVDPAALSQDILVEDFVLEGRGLRADLIDAITGGEVEATIEGASTLTLQVRDSKRELLRSDLLRHGVLMQAAGLDLELVKTSKQGSDLDFTFEDARVAAMRRRRKPRKASRNKVTRAQFVKSLVEEIGDEWDVEFVCPELDKRQPIGTARERRDRAERDARRERGIADDARLTAKGARATKTQLRNAERVLDVAYSHEAPLKAALALIIAAIGETRVLNLSGGDGTSSGILQVTAETARKLRLDPRDIERVCREFLLHGFARHRPKGAIELAREHPDWSAAEIAAACQGNAAGAASYRPWTSEGSAFLEAYGYSDRVRSLREGGRYEFTRGAPGGPRGEDTWACAERLAEEVGWRRFQVRNRFYFISEEDLIRSRPQMTVREHDGGVDNIDFDVDAGAKVDELTIHCQSRIWTAPPGSVIVVEGQGVADGRWLVATIRRPLFSTSMTVECRRGSALRRERPEPLPEEDASRGRRSTGGRAGVPDSVEAMYRKAKAITARRYPYSWGGGHNASFAPSGPKRGYDCSGAVSAVLHAGGLLDAPRTTSGFVRFGRPGRGRWVTIWVKETGNPRTSHMFMTFDLNRDGKLHFFEAGGGRSLVGLHGGRSTEGFEPRHVPGT